MPNLVFFQYLVADRPFAGLPSMPLHFDPTRGDGVSVTAGQISKSRENKSTKQNRQSHNNQQRGRRRRKVTTKFPPSSNGTVQHLVLGQPLFKKMILFLKRGRSIQYHDLVQLNVGRPSLVLRMVLKPSTFPSTSLDESVRSGRGRFLVNSNRPDGGLLRRAP